MSVITLDGNNYGLQPNHWTLARAHLCYDCQVNAVALAAFLYRDLAIETEEYEPSLDDLVELLREDFDPRSDEGFVDLFTVDWGEAVPESPFERLQ